MLFKLFTIITIFLSIETLQALVVDKYTIQLASFKTATEAETYKLSIPFHMSEIFTKMIQVKGEVWFRVQLGKYSNMPSAELKLKKVKSFSKNAFIRNINEKGKHWSGWEGRTNKKASSKQLKYLKNKAIERFNKEQER